MTRARRNRVEGLGMLLELYVPESLDYELRDRTAAEMAANIRKLARLGRYERWLSAVEAWASMVEAAPRAAPRLDIDGRRYLRWALLQGAIYAGHAC